MVKRKMARREFLKGSLAAGALLTIVPRRVLGGPRSRHPATS